MITLPNIYKGNYKLLAIIPILLLLISAVMIPNIKMGVDFTGGTLISLSLNQKVNADELKANLESEGIKGSVRIFDSAIGPKAEIELAQNLDLINAEELKSEFTKKIDSVALLEAQSNQNDSYVEEYLKERKTLNDIADKMFTIAKSQTKAGSIANLNALQKEFGNAFSQVYANYRTSISGAIDKHVSYSSISIQTVSPVLSTHFLEQAKWVVIFAAILSMVFVFIFFRVIVPSIAVLVGAASDVLIALGAMGLFGIPLTLSSFAALLMLVGFSLDTDVLLTIRMLKRKGDPREKAFDALKTGMTMSVMAIVAFGTLYILSTLTHIATYYEISAVALAGLVGDLAATWGVNAVMLLWYVESKGDA